jgi:transcriptional regulator with XRE-family HTH domain
MNEYPVDRYLRAGRAAADLSQRELAQRAGVAPHVVVAAESDPRRAHVHDFVRLLRSLGLALQIVDADGQVFEPESEDKARLTDRGRRRFPAHLDVRPTEEGWWGDGWPMFFGKVPTHTFDRSRELRDWRRHKQQRQEEDGAN